MMKKLISLMLTLLVLLCATSAFAKTVKVKENVASFDIYMDVPKGVAIKPEDDQGAMVATLAPTVKDGVVPEYLLTIAAAEEYDNRSMADLSDAEKQQIVDSWSVNMHEPTYVFVSADNGNPMLVMEENTEQNDFALLLTLYKGYFLSISARYDDFRKLSVDDITLMYELGNGIEFRDKK